VPSLAELHAAARDRGIPHYRRLARAELEESLRDDAERAPGAPVRLERDGPLAVVVLDDPSTRNAVGSAAMAAMEGVLDELERDEMVRLVAITGSGRVFSSGAGIREYDRMPDGGELLTDRGSAILDRLASLPLPVLALINGHAVGGGVEIALAADWRFIDPAADMRFVHASIGLVPGFGGMGRLRTRVGSAVTLRLLATCASVGGREAVAMGLADELVLARDQRVRALELAARVAGSDRAAVANAKAALTAGTREAERAAFLDSWPNRTIPDHLRA
jgi:enoyl-CoA hydratase/carnithine racemase